MIYALIAAAFFAGLATPFVVAGYLISRASGQIDRALAQTLRDLKPHD